MLRWLWGAIAQWSEHLQLKALAMHLPVNKHYHTSLDQEDSEQAVLRSMIRP